MIDAVENQAVEVDIKIDRPAKTLYERYPSALGFADAILFLCPPPQRGEYRLNKYAKDIPHQTGVVGQTVAQ